MRVLITGGAGELGIRLGRLLVERGHEVTVASRSARPTRDVAAVEMDLSTGDGEAVSWQVSLRDRSRLCSSKRLQVS